MTGFDPRPVLLATGQLYIAMALAVLAILYHRHTRLNLVAWTASGVCMGLTGCLYAMRDVAPDWLSLGVANPLSFAALFLKVPVLRLELGLAPRWRWFLACWLVLSGLFELAFVTGWPNLPRLVMVGLVQAAGALLVCRYAWSAARRIDSVGARLIAVAYGAFGALVMLRMARAALGLTDGLAMSPQPDFLAAVAAALLASLCGNVGYLGMALDRARDRDRAQHQALETLREQQQAQALSARARDAIRHERYRSSQVLAHEVRQPLHNAAVALQAATAALAKHDVSRDAAQAVARAQAVIRRVTASLDNTVAVAALLGGDERVKRHDVDLDMLVDLCVADLPAEARPRVRVEHLAAARSARMELSLVRLAVRNLLVNASLYAGPDSPIGLRLLDSDEPLALVIEVVDLGPGLPDDVWAMLQDRHDVPPPSVAPGHGLGLPIVQRVAAKHGGHLQWRPNHPSGSVFSLLLPQAEPD